LEYDKSLFTVSPEVLTQKLKTQGLVDKNIQITITCLKDLDSNKEISIYAYPANKTAVPKTPLEIITERKLAGRIIVVKNDHTVRKEQKFVLISIWTHASGGQSIIKEFSTEEKNNFYHALHQALIIPIVEETTLDLSQHKDFSSTGKHIEEGLIKYQFTHNGRKVTNGSLHPDCKKIFTDLKDEAGNEVNKKYDGCFTVFKFGIDTFFGNVGGAAEGIGVRNAIVFTSKYDTNGATLGHEILHGLGLQHTHRSKYPIEEESRKYIYPNGLEDSYHATTNIMSYSNTPFTSWYWQWQIINLNLKKK
jgi:type VI secretion system secreted protein VgrG